MTALAQRPDTRPLAPVEQPTSLVDLLDRLLGVGVVVAGDVTISLAGIDLVTVRLRALISSVSAVAEPPATDSAEHSAVSS